MKKIITSSSSKDTKNSEYTNEYNKNSYESCGSIVPRKIKVYFEYQVDTTLIKFLMMKQIIIHLVSNTQNKFHNRNLWLFSLQNKTFFNIMSLFHVNMLHIWFVQYKSDFLLQIFYFNPFSQISWLTQFFNISSDIGNGFEY